MSSSSTGILAGRAAPRAQPTRCSWPCTERRTRADIDPSPRRWRRSLVADRSRSRPARGTRARRGAGPSSSAARRRHDLDLSRPGRRAWNLLRWRARARDPRGHRRRRPPALPEVSEHLSCALHAARRSSTIERRHRLLPAGLVHDEVQPEDRRRAPRPCRASRACTPSSPSRPVQGALELLWRLERALCGDRRHGPQCHAATAGAGACGELTGLLIMPSPPHRAWRPAPAGGHPRLRSRHEPRDASVWPATRPSTCRAMRAGSWTSRPWRS
ncbi:MAG: hypothetical protein KatS3mg014_1359 [Actinomycetota bacterium]|nr:MAG: hypothetical protein KatS3mg014_1359 [Actinomycetota bacterium]